MIVGLGNKITSIFGVKYELLLPKYRDRNPRAIEFQHALFQDFQEETTTLDRCVSHLSKVKFPIDSGTLVFFKNIIDIHRNNLRESDLDFSLLELKKRLTSGQWLELSMYLLSMGFFLASFKARQYSYEAFNSLSLKFIYGINYMALKKALDFELGYYNFKNDSNVYWQAISKQSSTKDREKLDPGFFKFIHNKRVAVIGPLEFDKDYSKEIESFDVIVELNALASKREGLKKKYHGNPDVVYYNNFRLSELSKTKFDDLEKNAKYFVVKTQKYKSSLSKYKTTRIIPSTTMLNWNGSFSMLENTVVDLLLFQPAELKIFGVNLYTKFNYDRFYGNKPPEDIKRITLNFSVHDIFTQYLFMHNLHNQGLIKGDDVLEEVLQLGIEGYIEKMKSLYPKFLLNCTT